MEFKYSSSILFSNMGYVFKVLVWLLICFIITAGVAAAIFIPIFNMLTMQTDILNYIQEISSGFNGLLSSEISIKDFVQILGVNISDAVGIISTSGGGTAAIVISSIFIYFLYMFLSGLAQYPIADIVNNLMSSNMRFGFASNMALNLKKAARFSAARMLVTFTLDVCIVGIMIGLGFAFLPLLNIFAMPILVVVGILLCTGRAMLTAGWLPRLIHFPEEKVYTAFSRSLVYSKRNFKGYFKTYIITFSLAYLCGSAFFLPSFGLIALIVPSIYYFLLRTAELIGYYKLKGLCFYTDASTVINTVEFGYRSENRLDINNDDNGLEDLK